MTDLNNNLDITENFDTIKTLLNSIRAQGILNTSDVDKLLSGINAKLEKINTEEDIELIKIFLSDLKQNLEERHGILLSKFGAIESLFSNLLKNSSEALKTSEVKEIFDIVATNLTVFSREVVAQKEALSDITLKLDALRSDDSQKRDIIKNIALLKNDIERVVNGFDSIVLNLNDNFKTIISTISSLDNSESIKEFSKEIADITNSFYTILSALQVLDKKNSQLEEAIKGLATSDDISSTKKWISDLATHEQSLIDSINNLADKYYKIDNLADKIDASVDIIAGLKTIISDKDEKSLSTVVDKLNDLESALQTINLGKTEQNICNHFTQETAKLLELVDIDTTRTINEIASNSDSLSEKLSQAHALLSTLCEKNFAEVENNISDLKAVVSQIDENNVSANNAIFSNLTDRLAMFEGSLKNSLEKQEDYIGSSSNKLLEQINSIKDLSGILDYKMDASVIEFNNAKIEISDLKTAVENMLAIDFVSYVRNLKEELYTSKQEITGFMENSTSDLADKFSNDLFRTYELLIGKLENTESELKDAQKAALSSTKEVIDKIWLSTVDILSYVSSNQDESLEVVENKIDELSRTINDNTLTYVERVKDILDSAVKNLLTNDFVNYVSNLKEELYTSKQEITAFVGNSTNNLADKLSSDLFSKYELLIGKLENTESELKNAQMAAFSGTKEVLDKIWLSTVDILSYVSSNQDESLEVVENKIDELSRTINDNTLTYVERVKDILDAIKVQVDGNIKTLYEGLGNKFEEIKHDNENIRNDIKLSYEKLLEVQDNINNVSGGLFNNINGVISTTDSLKEDFDNKLTSLKNAIIEKVIEFQQEFSDENAEKMSEIKFATEQLYSKHVQTSIDSKNEIKNDMNQLVATLKLNIESLSEQLATASSKLESVNNDIVGYIKDEFGSRVDVSVNELQSQADELITNVDVRVDDVITKFCDLEESVNSLSNTTTSSLTATLAKILDNFVSLKALLTGFNDANAESLKNSIDIISNDFAKLREKVDTVDSNIDEDLTRQLSLIEHNFEALYQNLVNLFTQNNTMFTERMDNGLNNVALAVKNTVIDNLTQYKNQVEALFNNISARNNSQAEFINEKVLELNTVLNKTLCEQNAAASESLRQITSDLRQILAENIEVTFADYEALKNKLDAFASELTENNTNFANNLKSQLDDITKFVDSGLEIQAREVSNKFNEISLELINLSDSSDTLSSEFKDLFGALNSRLDNDEVSRINQFRSQLKEFASTFNALIVESKMVTKAEISSISEILIKNSKEVMEDLEASIDEKVNSILVVSADVSAGELQTMEMLTNKIIEQIEINRQSVEACRDYISNVFKSEINFLVDNIEKETDVIVKELIEQVNLLKDAQKDEISKLAIQIENNVEDSIYNHISDLKSYFDIKADNTVLSTKLDNMGLELSKSAENILSASSKLLEATVFDDAIADMKKTNEIIISSMSDSLNKQMQEFIKSNISEDIKEKFILFDKKFTDAVVDKYEEIKLISGKYNNAFANIENSVKDLTANFSSSKDELSKSVMSVLECINEGIDDLSANFEKLKNQVLNLELEESVVQQVNNIEKLTKEQFKYLEDISNLCCDNLPELTEMNTIVKYNVLESLKEINSRLESKNDNVSKELNLFKTDIITQFLNIFNQISFITEQEEILDFIQEKHSDLITILSHIVTTVDSIETVKDNLEAVENKVDTIKEDIGVINEKIASIISSEGNVDYVYSLQDIESDIAGLRLTLNELKKDSNYSRELDDLIASTNKIYTLVKDIPTFEPENFRKDFDSLSEDIVSISTRTNKLILASDESYKTLQENLQDFKLVINDLDERTRNFAQECGMDRIDNKLGAINSMIQNGAKTNQVFNQVFEYLAGWVDNAGAQIAAISDKVETLDDIGQIKVMIEDLKAEAEDDSASAEMIEALGVIFDKQAKKIASLEAKLDRVIVETTISNKNNKVDMTPMEETLNRFLVAIDDKISSQQARIDSIESKLEDVVSKFDSKDTAQLTKKVGGMDRQIAKLNKSIEKIASHVVEK